MIKNNLISAQQEYLKGNKDKAKEICLNIVNKNPDSNIYNFLGVIELTDKNHRKSLSYFHQSLRMDQNNIKALNNIGNALIQKHKYYSAINFLKKAIKIDNKFIQAYLNISLAYLKIKNFKDSRKHLEKILTIDKSNFFAFNNLGKIYYEERKYNKSLNHYLKALELNRHSEILYNNLGLLYERKNKFKKAQLYFKNALDLKPDFFDCQFNLALLSLKIGNCKEGIKLYDARFFKKEKKNKSLINNDALKINLQEIEKNKKVYIIAEQGYGDIFQFSRIGLILKKIGFIVVFIINDELYEFFKNQKIFHEYVKKSDLDFNKIASNQIIPLLSIPRIFNLNIRDFIFNDAYIFADQNKSKYWANKINNNNINVGVVWSASDHLHNYERSIPINLLNKISKLKNIKLVSLHTKKHLDGLNKNLADLRNILFFDNLDTKYKFVDTAALIENLDLVISIDTGIAHLSASMGKKTWIILPYHHDWRWSLNSNKSYWYHSVKLFRSKKYNDWENIIKNVLLDLKKLKSELYG